MSWLSFHHIKLKWFGYKIGIQINKTLLVIDKINYATQLVNICIAHEYDLDNWLRNPLNNFALKNCLFGATNIVKIRHKGKYINSTYGIAFDRWDLANISHEFARNVANF